MSDTTKTSRDDVPETTDTAEHNGQVYRFVASSAALAMQDATNHLRNISTISTTAAGVAMSQMLSAPADTEHMQRVIDAANRLQEDAVKHFQQMGQNVAALLAQFPKGE